jgi:hypothetical protein
MLVYSYIIPASSCTSSTFNLILVNLFVCSLICLISVHRFTVKPGQVLFRQNSILKFNRAWFFLNRPVSILKFSLNEMYEKRFYGILLLQTDSSNGTASENLAT